MSAPARRTLALGLDLGTTRIKVARLLDDGTLADLLTVPTPPLAGDGLVREGDPLALLRAAEELWAAVHARLEKRRGARLGLACQRSSLLLWRRADGAPVTPLVSWQDRRAEPWCRAHAESAERVRELTGLRLSPHYAGPKLAHLFAADPALRGAAERGELGFGTLDAWCLWNWSGGARHATDLGMAARTLLVDAARGAWSDELLALFGVPRAILPEIVPSSGAPLGELARLAGAPLCTAGLADQAASLLAVLPQGAPDVADAALANFGTGCFVLRPTGRALAPRRGYLAGPLLEDAGGRRLHVQEGTINAGGPGADALSPAPTDWRARLPEAAFCLPDENGLGSPYWRADFPRTFSRAARDLPPPVARRILVEGLLFRTRQILDDLLGSESRASRLLVSGGLTHDPGVPAALASLIDLPVEVVLEPETTLLGAARLAAVEPVAQTVSTRRVEPALGLGLRERFPAWSAWAAAATATR